MKDERSTRGWWIAPCKRAADRHFPSSRTPRLEAAPPLRLQGSASLARYHFIDPQCRGGAALPVPGAAARQGGRVRAPFAMVLCKHAGGPALEGETAAG
jgi:hypothetical protein